MSTEHRAGYTQFQKSTDWMIKGIMNIKSYSMFREIICLEFVSWQLVPNCGYWELMANLGRFPHFNNLYTYIFNWECTKILNYVSLGWSLLVDSDFSWTLFQNGWILVDIFRGWILMDTCQWEFLFVDIFLVKCSGHFLMVITNSANTVQC